MLKTCPKCRNFYDAADLRFCFKDGVPLVSVADENENLRQEGKEFISRTEYRIKREIFNSRIQKIMFILITTILTILVISVVTINSWLYFNPEEEAARIEKPSPAPEPTFQKIAETIPPEISETATPTPNATPVIEISPEPTPIPTIEIIKTPTPKPPKTPEPIITPPPTLPPTLPPNPPPTIVISDNCSPDEKSKAIAFIKNKYAGMWRDAASRQKQRARKKKIAPINQLPSEQVAPDLNFTPETISVSPSKNCQTATVSIEYFWTARSADGKVLKTPRRQNYVCRRDGANWNCN